MTVEQLIEKLKRLDQTKEIQVEDTRIGTYSDILLGKDVDHYLIKPTSSAERYQGTN